MLHVKAFLFLLVLAALSVIAMNAKSQDPMRNVVAEDNRPQEQRVIKVTIATVGPMLGPPTKSYHVGQQIPVAINLTNTSTSPLYSCVSGDLYQDLPKLRRDGKLLPYTSWQNYLLQSAEKNRTCLNDDIPSSELLPPNTPTLVDSLIVSDDGTEPTGALAWYDQLSPGHYELSVQRRFGCCDGPMTESNTINFDVVP